MAMRDRYLTFDGVNLKDAYGLIYSSFSEKLPEPKVITVDIPAGTDLDITSALGPVGWHNGTHVLKFLLYGGTEAGRLEKKRAIIAALHGVRASYKLSWEPYTYTGRATVSIEHRTEEADLLTVTIDRAPWKSSTTRETHVIDCHPDGSYTLEGSARYKTVRAKLLQSGTADIGATQPTTPTERNAGTYTLASDVFGSSTVWLSVDEWVLYEDGTEDLQVNPDRLSISSGDATIEGDYTDAQGTSHIGDRGYVVDGDLRFDLIPLQKATVDFYRWDV